MAGEVERSVVEKDVKKCNKDLEKFGKYKDLSIDLDALKNQVKSLAEQWQTENGEKEIEKLNAVVRKLQTCITSLNKAIGNIQRQQFEFSSVEEYKRTERL